MTGQGPFLRAVVALVYCFLLAPLVFVVLISFSADSFIVFPPSGWSTRWYAALARHAGILEAFRNSLVVSSIVTTLALLLGVPAAYAVARGRFRGRDALFGAFTSPLVLPTVVIGLGALLLFTRLRLVATFPGLVCGQLIVTLPFVIRILVTSLSTLPPDVEDAAATLGASPWKVFRRVTLPLALPGLLAAATLSFLIAFDEVVISLFLSGPRLSTLPVEVFHYVERRADPLVAALSVVLIAATAAIVIVIERLVGVARAVGR